MSSRCYCAHCQHEVKEPSRLGSLALYMGAWIVAVFGPFLLFAPLALFGVAVLPIGTLLMAGVLSPLHERAFGTPRCPTCRRYTERAPVPRDAPRAALARSITSPA